MGRFSFYSKNNPAKEAIGVIEAATREEAVKYFSLAKMLSVNDFLTIFEVKSYGFEESTQTGNKQLLKG